ncbi:sensor histidine kinase [Actinoplanes sp. RD1]|uniref:ATP-binding protein n=1 Tax=Actinoplanes sp. RD1 TaxID=3064538 RepID=UPI00274274B2|nr:ATP-binding protein [Actinoplanes sp. RD1]
MSDTAAAPSTRSAPSLELLASTTYKLIRPFEAVALLLQATNLFASAINDRYAPGGVPVVLALGVVHLVLAGVVLRHRGPLTRGRAWVAAWIATIFVVQILLAHLLAPGDFAAYGVGVPMGNYALIPLAVLAFYPWSGFRDARRRRLIEAGLIVAVVLHPLLILGLMHRWQLTTAHLRSVALYGGWALVWFLVGKGMARLCRIAVQVETDALSASYAAALGDLHTHAERAASQIAAGHDARTVARDLQSVITARRRQLLLQDEYVGAADLVKNAIRAHGDRLRLLSAPALGGLTIPRRHAVLLDQGLADLLKNVVVHGGGSVEVDFVVAGSMMTLEVRDHGPGLGPGVFATGSSLQRLRRRLAEAGGDLQLLPAPPGGGAAVRLELPLRPRR